MPPVHDEGVIVHCLPYSETSLIVVWLTHDHGILRTLAKGARRPRQPLFGKIDVLRAGHLTFSPSRSSQLHTLREFEPETTTRPSAHDYGSLLATSYFYELIARLAEPQSAIPEIYTLYRKALGHLETHDADRRLVERFELRVFQLMGVHDGSVPHPVLRQRLLHPLPKTWYSLVRHWADLSATNPPTRSPSPP